MTLTVRERADTLGTLRYASVHAMETLAAWVPTTPDLEAKILFGRHIWEFAQHADQLGRRTHELRAALHYTPAPTPAYDGALALLRSTAGARERISAFHDVFLADLADKYADYLAATDAFLDEPSVRVVERITADLRRMTADAAEARAQRPALTGSGVATAAALAAALAAARPWVRHRAPAAGIAEATA
ncbi:MAG: hypothetical protein HY275_18995 [Gemmatimonadetes bacterium]|nr:hypothetical protein [Gemmatimonadota bacterium]